MPEIYEGFALTKIFLRSCECGALQYHPEGTRWWKCPHCKGGAPFSEPSPSYWVLVKPFSPPQKVLDKREEV